MSIAFVSLSKIGAKEYMPKPSDWIVFAIADLKASKILINSDFAIAIVFYHCQQAAEKSLKAYLNYRNNHIPKTHDLVGLLNCCILLDAEFKVLSADAYDLNPFSTSTHYPDDAYLLPDITTAKECIKKAERILEFVKQKVT